MRQMIVHMSQIMSATKTRNEDIFGQAVIYVLSSLSCSIVWFSLGCSTLLMLKFVSEVISIGSTSFASAQYFLLSLDVHLPKSTAHLAETGEKIKFAVSKAC